MNSLIVLGLVSIILQVSALAAVKSKAQEIKSLLSKFTPAPSSVEGKSKAVSTLGGVSIYTDQGYVRNTIYENADCTGATVFSMSLALNTCLITDGAANGNYAAIFYSVDSTGTLGSLIVNYYSDVYCTVLNGLSDQFPNIPNGCDRVSEYFGYSGAAFIPSDSNGVLVSKYSSSADCRNNANVAQSATFYQEGFCDIPGVGIFSTAMSCNSTTVFTNSYLNVNCTAPVATYSVRNIANFDCQVDTDDYLKIESGYVAYQCLTADTGSSNNNDDGPGDAQKTAIGVSIALIFIIYGGCYAFGHYYKTHILPKKLAEEAAFKATAASQQA